MKKTITKLNTIILFLFISVCSHAQTYVMVQDSSVRSDSFHTDTFVKRYVWNGQLHLTRINYFWGSNSIPNGYDLVYTNSSGRIDSVVGFDQGNNPTGQHLINTWNGSDLMMQEKTRNNGMGPLQKSTNTFIYNAGKIAIWTQHSDTFGGGGNNGPDSVTNIVNTGGNLVSGLIYSQGTLMGTATLEYDSMPNPYKGWAVDDNFPDFFTTNNLRKVYLASPFKLINMDALTYANGMLASRTKQKDKGSLEANYYTYAAMVGMQEITSEKTLTLYPNPSTEGIFNIDLSNVQSLKSIDVYDVTGRSIMSENNFSNTYYTKINLSNQPKGIYFLKIKTADIVKTARLFVE